MVDFKNRIIPISYTFLVIASILFTSSLYAQEDCIPDKPDAYRATPFVYDHANVFKKFDDFVVNGYSSDIEDSLGVEILIISLDSLCGLTPMDYATKLGIKWGVGKSELDNGLVVLIKPKKAENDKGECVIAVGRGLEGTIPDGMAHLIINQIMIPKFKLGRYTRGIELGLEEISKLISDDSYYEKLNKKYYPNRYENTNESSGLVKAISFLFSNFYLIILAFILFKMGYRLIRALIYSQLNKVSLLKALTLTRGKKKKHKGKGDDFMNGKGSFERDYSSNSSSSSRSSSFDDFGGGSFGGGGASGSW